jgi:cellulose biosynthesis protein BcsQ
METITFYSYKGGVGRTLALSNLAMYLYHLGFKVCLIDFDLEAPGIPYKFPTLIKTEDINNGLVDYIHFFLKKGRFPPSLKKFSREILPAEKSRGGIRIIPAGNTLSAEYWKKISSINWYSLFFDEDDDSNVGIPFFFELKERIEQEFKPDFLLIDSRSGITEMSGICTSILPDKVVFFIINNKENLEGARQILRGLQNVKRIANQEPIKIIFSLSRIPAPLSDKKEEIEAEKKILRYIIDYVNASIEDLSNQLNLDDICVLHSERQLELSEVLKITGEEVTGQTTLYHDYLKLFSKIIPISQFSHKTSYIAYISFHGADREAAVRLVSNLRADGIDVWLDTSEFKPGDDIERDIISAIKECPVFIPLISTNSKRLFRYGKPMFHFREWEWLNVFNKMERNKSKTIIPIIIDDTDWMYDKFRNFYSLKIPYGKKESEDYEKLKKKLLEIQEKTR